MQSRGIRHVIQAAPGRAHGVRKLGTIDDQDRLGVVVVLRQRPVHPSHPRHGFRRAQAALPPQHRRSVSHEELAELHRCDPLDLAKVISYASDHRLAVIRFEPACRHLVLEGSVADVNAAFGVELSWFDHGDKHAHGHEGPIHLPADVAQVVEHVLGLDHTPFRRPSSMRTGETREARDSLGTPISPLELAEHYRYPPHARGRGQRIAIIALGGGYHDSDLLEYFRDVLGFTHTPVIRAISVDGAKNEPLELERLRAVMSAYNDPKNSLADLRAQFPDDLGPAIATVETTMDVQLALAVAPEAEIDVYFAPGSPKGFYHVVHAICGLDEATDEAGQPYEPGPPDVISLSWSQPEGLLAESARAIDAAFDRARSLGVCAVCCSGDSGSYGFKREDGNPVASVMYPASSPTVLAVGGTQFPAGVPDATAEHTWNDDNRGSQQASGGGVSGGFPIPPWQQRRGVPPHGDLDGPAWIFDSSPKAAAFVGRGVPDVAAFANQVPGYAIRVGGVDIGAGGTSAATPMWAGLIARLGEALGQRIPWFSEIIYHPAFSSAFRNITEGNNAIDGYEVASFSAADARAHRWSPCAGLGVPDGTAILEVLRQARQAGVTARYDAAEYAERRQKAREDDAVEAGLRKGAPRAHQG